MPRAKAVAKSSSNDAKVTRNKTKAVPKARAKQSAIAKTAAAKIAKAKVKVAPKPMPKASDFKRMFDGTNMLTYNSISVTDKGGIIYRNPSIWVDKYRPQTLDDVKGHDDLKKVIRNAIQKGDLPHLLLYGPPGTGKTSITHAMVRELYGNNISKNVLELNASDENGINVVRDKIIRFASLEASDGKISRKKAKAMLRRSDALESSNEFLPETMKEKTPFKVIILDEADSMTRNAQTALKKAMEKTCEITRFVIICNYDNKIIDAIRSRCSGFRFDPIPSDMMISKLKTIAESEGIEVESEDVYADITRICNGDARRCINTLQNLRYIPMSEQNVSDVEMEMVSLGFSKPRPPEELRPITVDDVKLITSSIDYKYFNRYWRKITKCSDCAELNELAHAIIMEGYPMNYVLEFLKDKILESKLDQISQAEVLVHIGKVERMLANGSGNHIQTLGIITLIVSKFKEIDVIAPNIF